MHSFEIEFTGHFPNVTKQATGHSVAASAFRCHC